MEAAALAAAAEQLSALCGAAGDFGIPEPAAGGWAGLEARVHDIALGRAPPPPPDAMNGGAAVSGVCIARTVASTLLRILVTTPCMPSAPSSVCCAGASGQGSPSGQPPGCIVSQRVRAPWPVLFMLPFTQQRTKPATVSSAATFEGRTLEALRAAASDAEEVMWAAACTAASEYARNTGQSVANLVGAGLSICARVQQRLSGLWSQREPSSS